MNIVIVAENSLIPVEKYGGAQRVIWSLGRELPRIGHFVSYLVRRGSACPFAKIIERNPSVPIIAQIPENTDVVHFNSPVPQNFPLPFIETIHGNFNKNITQNAVFVSRNHAERFGCKSYVYNGLDWSEYGDVELDNKRTYYHFLGKAAWRVKNVRGSIQVAKQLDNETLHVLGGQRFNFKMGWRFTFSPNIHFHGMVGGKEKFQLLNGSRGMIFPVIWHEPFGLAVIESLYFGAPIFCTPYGAMPEIVTLETGYMTSSAADMVNAIRNADFSPKICHEYARDTFNSRRMAEGYLSKYEIVMNGKMLNSTVPQQVTEQTKTVWNE